MIREFNLTNPFAHSTEIFTAMVDLDHDVIATWMRKELSGCKDYTSYFDKDFNSRMTRNMPLCGELLNAIEAASATYAKTRYMDLKWFDGSRPDIWFSEYIEGERHTLHNHPRALIAGTYYPYADDDSCPIAFRHPAHGMMEIAEPWMCETAPKDAVHTIYKLRPKTGMLNLWPSWMMHEVGPQGPVPKERSRLAISFNYGRG